MNLTLCSFNIRYGSAPDGENAWPLRRAAVVATLRQIDADLIGLQECEAAQRDALQADLPGYRWISAGRNDGRDAGEMCAMLIREGVGEIEAAGHFWLSDTPDVPGSRSWGNDLPRMATWCRLRLADPAWPPLLYINTHLDHASKPARFAGIDLVRHFLADHTDAAPIVTGDFNAPLRSPELARLTADSRLHNVALRGGTFHSFFGGTLGPAIDWILHDSRLHCTHAAVVRQKVDGRWPSDHYPVVATLQPA